MKATRALHDLGQSLWLDYITRNLLSSGTLQTYIAELSVTGLTSNPTIFDQAIKNSNDYDADIREKFKKSKSGEELFFDLALQDITAAADLFREIHDRTLGVDGYVSLEVSPLLAHDTKATVAAARELHARAQRPNVLIKIPGTKEGLPAIEEAIFAGIPVNVTLLFSREHYLAAAEAYLRGIERRIEAGLTPGIASVASVFISRWDVAVAGKVPDALRDQLGIAIAKRTYKAYSDLLTSPRFMRSYNAGARPQRLLWASTGTKDPKASDILYIKALAAPLTVNTMPQGTLKAFTDHGEAGATMPVDGGDCEEVLARFAKAGIDPDALAAQLQDDGANSFVKSWNDLMALIESKNPRSWKKPVSDVATASTLSFATEGAGNAGPRRRAADFKVLVADVGGTNVKLLATGEQEPRKFVSGPTLTPGLMMSQIKRAVSDWGYSAVSIGYPGPVAGGRPLADPRYLGPGWVGFDFAAAFGCPVKIINDAAMQAIGSYRSGKMLFLGLGTGLGAAMITNGFVEPLEIRAPSLPERKLRGLCWPARDLSGLARSGALRHVIEVVAHLMAVLEPSDTVIGGGNVKKLDELPPNCRAGKTLNAFRGGFQLWDTKEPSTTRRSKVRILGLSEVGGRGAPMHEETLVTKRAAWKALEDHQKTIRRVHLRDLFADDPQRGTRMTAEAAGVFLDYRRIASPAKRSSFSPIWQNSRAYANGSAPCSGARRSIPPKAAPRCMLHFVRQKGRQLRWTARMSCRKSRRARQNGRFFQTRP